MLISIIAAIGKNNELGKDNDLIWHFRDDMKFFKATTTGNTVIMGRKTFESLPHALPDRRNIVITSNKDYKAEGAEVVTGVQEALDKAKGDNIFIIGGGKIYGEFMQYADSLYLTEIDAECKDADTFFPKFDKSAYTKELIAEYEVSGIRFSHVLYKKK